MKNKFKNRKFEKILYILFVIITIYSGINNGSAATFNVGVSVCVPDWYCTAYDQGSCGSRTCIDTNSCGSDYNKPSEYLECESSGGGGSSSSSGGAQISQRLPDGYFTINFNNIKLELEQNKVEQKIIKINSSTNKEYELKINYPSSYLGTKEFLTTTSNKKYIEGIGDFNIIIDTRGVSIGTYVIPIIISNDKSEKEILFTIDVVPEKNAIRELIVDSKIKTLGVDKELEVAIETSGNKLNVGDKIEYSIIDPKGNKLFIVEETISDISNIIQKIPIPADISEGYYTLSAKIENSNGIYVKSVQFTILTPNKYYPILQKPKNINIFNIIISAVLIALIGFIIHSKIYSDNLGARKFRSEIKWRKENMRTKIIDLKIKDKLKRLTSKFVRSDKKDASNKAELLKQSYEKGYINVKEYNDALNSEGYHVGKYDNVKIEAPKEEKDQTPNLRNEPVHNVSQHHTHHKIEDKELKEDKKEESKEKEISEKQEKKEHKHEKEKTESKDEVTNVKELLKYVKEEETRHIVEDPKPKLKESKVSVLETRTHNQAFILNNGVTLHSMADLLKALDYMPQDVFNHHTAHGRNDFATWIWDVFRYGDIAEEVRDAKTKEDLVRILKKYE